MPFNSETPAMLQTAATSGDSFFGSIIGPSSFFTYNLDDLDTSTLVAGTIGIVSTPTQATIRALTVSWRSTTNLALAPPESVLTISASIYRASAGSTEYDIVPGTTFTLPPWVGQVNIGDIRFATLSVIPTTAILLPGDLFFLGLTSTTTDDGTTTGIASTIFGYVSAGMTMSVA